MSVVDTAAADASPSTSPSTADAPDTPLAGTAPDEGAPSSTSVPRADGHAAATLTGSGGLTDSQVGVAATAGRGSGERIEVLLTGATGFVGKVVLEDLLRTRPEIDSVYLLVRPKGRVTPDARLKQLLRSPVFARLPHGWERKVKVVGGELTEPGGGLSDDDRATLQDRITHVIHCAASVEFDLPVKVAAESNVTSALAMLELVRTFPKLVRFVSVSTAYVTPFPGKVEPVGEVLAPLPRPANEILADIDKGVEGETLMAETGHPNTYTLTKCLAEHLLSERRGDVPLTIVRPSIVSACWKEPVAGWIDSRAAFAAFVAMIGSGHLRALIGDPTTPLDIVPCDVVSDRTIAAAFEDPPATEPGQAPPIRYAVAGFKNGCKVQLCVDTITSYYRDHPIDRKPKVHYVGHRGKRYRLTALWQHQLKVGMRHVWANPSRRQKIKRRAQLQLQQTDYLNTAFPYFTQNTFDFRASQPFEDPEFDPEAYIRTVCAGVYKYLMRRDETELSLGGQRQSRILKDLPWAVTQPQGGVRVRVAAYGLRKTFRKIAHNISFDEPSFEIARDTVPDGALCIYVPSRRQYVDVCLLAFLCFSRPDLGISTLHTTNVEFAGQSIPALRQLFQQLRMPPDHPLLVSVDGESEPRRRYLRKAPHLIERAMKEGRPVVLVPVAAGYDHVPGVQPESADGVAVGSDDAPAPKTLRGLIAWAWRLYRDRPELGRVHLAAGEPLILQAEGDEAPDATATRVRRELQAQWQAVTTPTTFHLRSFLAQHPIEGIDLDSLADAITSRGGRVVDSDENAAEPAEINERAELAMREQWMPIFFPDVHTLRPGHPVLAHLLAEHGFEPETDGSPTTSTDKVEGRLTLLLDKIVEPVCLTYVKVIEHIDALAKEKGGSNGSGEPVRITDAELQRVRGHRPFVELAVRFAIEKEALRPDGSGWVLGSDAAIRKAKADVSNWRPSESTRIKAVSPSLVVEPTS